MKRTFNGVVSAAATIAALGLLGACVTEPLGIPRNGGVAKASTLGIAQYGKRLLPKGGSAVLVAELDNGKHSLSAALDGSGNQRREARAWAQHSLLQQGAYVQFNIEGAQDGAPMPLRFELHDAEWTVGRVTAQPKNTPPFEGANPLVRAKLVLALAPDKRTARDTPTGTPLPLEAVFQPAGGAALDHTPVTAQFTGAGVLTADVTVVSGGVYKVRVIAHTEGADDNNSLGYSTALGTKYVSLVVYNP